jgi:ADP-ribosyl-[dinitrogen reductase] hydrolase
MKSAPSDRIVGLLLGTAVGDALGLPAEGLRPAMIRRLRWSGHWRHRFLPGRGMWSDDTEHTIMLAQALLASQGKLPRFTRAFASELRWWLLGLPAGTGFATARAILRLWLGYPPQKSGVFSAGNGPCMRTALIGACFPENPLTRRSFTEAQTRLTHSDPKAFIAALAVTELAALLSTTNSPPSLDEFPRK